MIMKIYAKSIEDAVKTYERIKAAEADPEAAEELEAQPDDYLEILSELGVRTE